MQEARFSGVFYPSDPEELQQLVNRAVQNASIPKIEAPIYAIITPHAGYTYSGNVAAHAFKSIRKRNIKTAVIMGPSHQYYFQQASILDETAYDTPLGPVKINQKKSQEIIQASDLITQERAPHENEHAIEVELPFFKTLFPETEIIPMIIGDIPEGGALQIAQAIMTRCKKEETLVIASTDFSHFYPNTIATEMDLRAIENLKRQDIHAIKRDSQEELIQLCGLQAVLVMLEILKKWGITQSEQYLYQHSGQVSGDNTRVVGYNAMSFY